MHKSLQIQKCLSLHRWGLVLIRIRYATKMKTAKRIIEAEVQKRGIPNSVALEFLRAVTGKPDASGRLEVRMMEAMETIGLPKPDTHLPVEWIADNVEAIHAYVIKWKREKPSAPPIPNEYRHVKQKKPKGFSAKRGGLTMLVANDFLRIVHGTAKGNSGASIDALLKTALKKIGFELVALKSSVGWEGINLIIREHVSKWKANNPGVQLRPISSGNGNYSRATKKAYINSEPKFYTPDTSAAYRKLSYDEANSPNFLESREWKALRMAVLAKYGNACMCCGAKPDPARNLFANVDHIIARRKRPDLSLCFNNLQVLCSDCNGGKLNWDETDWRPKEGRTPSVVIVDEPTDSVHDDLIEYVDMATVRLIRDIAK